MNACTRARVPRLAIALALLLAVDPGAAPASPPDGPSLLLPPRSDSVSIESEPAPLLVPGRPSPVDSLVPTPRQFARQQLELGRDMERAGNLLGALLAYRNALAADSTIRDASLRTGLLEMQLGRTAQAERSFRAELARDPGNSDASRQLAIALSAQGKHTAAIQRLRRLVAREPARDEHWYALGVALANANRLREAEPALRRALALAPERPLEHRDLGVVLASLKRAREARGEYRRALALAPADPSIWLDLGNLEARVGRADSALAAYRQAERCDSSYTLAYEAQIKALVRLDRRDDVADVYLRWVAARPGDTELRLRAVRHLASLGRRDRALEIARDGVRSRGNSAAAHLILGLALDAYGATREALAELRQAERLFRTPRDQARVRALIASMRQSSPDSLRELFAADSAAHADHTP